jgi:hypothetical protein
MEKEIEPERSLIISYMTLRKAIGFLGVALPFVVSLGALILFRTGIQGSISSYYYTGMREVLVGILWSIGVFLLSYNGYTIVDALAGKLGCVFAVGITLFPTTPDNNPSAKAVVIGHVHLAFAALFFLTLIYFSYFLFTKTSGEPDKHPITRRKRQRNNVYRVCGVVMAVCILLIGTYQFLPDKAASVFKVYDPIFWLETIAIVAFGISWLIKGETLLKDQVE